MGKAVSRKLGKLIEQFSSGERSQLKGTLDQVTKHSTKQLALSKELAERRKPLEKQRHQPQGEGESEGQPLRKEQHKVVRMLRDGKIDELLEATQAVSSELGKWIKEQTLPEAMRPQANMIVEAIVKFQEFKVVLEETEGAITEIRRMVQAEDDPQWVVKLKENHPELAGQFAERLVAARKVRDNIVRLAQAVYETAVRVEDQIASDHKCANDLHLEIRKMAVRLPEKRQNRIKEMLRRFIDPQPLSVRVDLLRRMEKRVTSMLPK
jgi:hypothetical protein